MYKRQCLESPPHQDILRVTVSPDASLGFSPSVWAAAVVFSAPAAVVGSAVLPEPEHLSLIHIYLSIGEIAARTGYTNSKNFSRAFHNYYHMTPMQYRKKGET